MSLMFVRPDATRFSFRLNVTTELATDSVAGIGAGVIGISIRL